MRIIILRNKLNHAGVAYIYVLCRNDGETMSHFIIPPSCYFSLLNTSHGHYRRLDLLKLVDPLRVFSQHISHDHIAFFIPLCRTT